MAHQTDKQYRMADVFQLPVKHDYLFESPRLDLSGDEAVLAVHAINTHDAMQDRIADLEKQRDAAISREREANREWSNAAKKWVQERDQLKAQNAEYHTALHYVATQSITALPGTGTQEWMKKKAKDALIKSPAVCLAEIQAKAIEEFKQELIKSVSIMYRPHIEGVCAVVTDRLRQQTTPTDISTKDDKPNCDMRCLHRDDPASVGCDGCEGK